MYVCSNWAVSLFYEVWIKTCFLILILYKKGERNLENVTHEEAVATLKSITDKVTLVVGKTNLSITTNPSDSVHATSHSISNSVGNNIGQSVVDIGRSTSPAPTSSLSRSHSPRKSFLFKYSTQHYWML